MTNVRPSSFAGRLVFGKFLSSTQWLTLGAKLHRLLPHENPTVTLDTFVPMSRVGEFLAWYERELAFYPLWMVPYRRVRDYEWLADGFYKDLEDDLFLDIALYGLKQTGRRVGAHRRIEEKLMAIGGIKTLISHNYYSEAEFWSIFNRPNYDAVKRLTDPDNAFRDVYTKMCKAAMGIA